MYAIAAIILAPLLLLQAWWVKRCTPRLAEPEGPRQGGSGQGRRLRLLILGDSAAAGVGVRTQAQALSGQLSDRLRQDYQLRWTLLARSGLTTEGTLGQLSTGKWATANTQTYDLVLLSLGVNDVLSPIGVKRWLALTAALIEALRHQSPDAEVLITPVPPLGEFPAFPQPLAWFLARRCDDFNRALTQLCQQRAACHLLVLSLPLTTCAMADDGFHPSESSYRLWAQTACKHIAGQYPPN